MISLLVSTGILTGIFAHYGIFFHGEWHLRLMTILVGHIVMATGVYFLITKFSTSWPSALLLLAVFQAAYLGSLFISMIFYRLCLSPLKSFQGPRILAVTKFRHVYLARRSTNHLVMQDLHEKYGTSVRTGIRSPYSSYRLVSNLFAGPNEITKFHSEAIEAFDNIKAKAIKDEFYDLIHPLTSAVFTRDPIVHKERRAVWTQGLGTKGRFLDILPAT